MEDGVETTAGVVGAMLELVVSVVGSKDVVGSREDVGGVDDDVEVSFSLFLFPSFLWSLLSSRITSAGCAAAPSREPLAAIL